MLAGSTPTRTGRPWKKISSRQPTRINARHYRSRCFRTRPAACPAAWTQRRVCRAGACLCPQDQGQQDEDLLEAQAHGRGGDGELLLFARGEFDRVSQPVPEPGILLAEELVLLDQFGARRPAGVLGRDGGLDLVGMVVDGLSAAVGDLGLMGDVAIPPVKPPRRWRSKSPGVS